MFLAFLDFFKLDTERDEVYLDFLLTCEPNVFYMVPQVLIQSPNLSLYKVVKSLMYGTSSQ